jgi:hypothetical protein
MPVQESSCPALYWMSWVLKSLIQSSSYSTSIVSFFILYKPVLQQLSDNVKFRKLLLNFIVSNNLVLQLVDQPSFRQLVQYLNPSALIISTSILNRDFEKAFLFACNTFKTELQEYIKAGSRISITTDTWSARNYKEFITVTGYWIDKSWKYRLQLLDIVYLKDPIYSGKYFAEQLLLVTNNFNITEYIFTVTRDNIKPNNIMLDNLEATADQQRYKKPENLQ